MDDGKVDAGGAGLVDWSQLYRSNSEPLHRWLCRDVGPTAADDLTQETFAQAIKCFAKSEPRRDVQAWLRGIAKNLLLNFFRSSGAQRRAEQLLANIEAVRGSDGLEESIQKRDQTNALNSALGNLPDLTRYIFERYEFDGVSAADLARETNRSEGAIRTLCCRTRTRLREEMKRAGCGLGVLALLFGVSIAAEMLVEYAQTAVGSDTIALVDADNDRDEHLFTAPYPARYWSSSAFANLDGEGDQKVVLGPATTHHDGQEPGYPSIANLDDDPELEVLVTNTNGVVLINHDGSVQFPDQLATGDEQGRATWLRPSTVHDFDSDGPAELATSSAINYRVYKPQGPTIAWQEVSNQSEIATGTAFDFLGDGVAEAMYGDEAFMFIFGASGEMLLKSSRKPETLSEYPIVADIDNDGSAEIVVVSNYFNDQMSPTVQVVRDKEDRWIQARRIWNQHTYHVTNVREDVTIPQFEPPSWQQISTYRTNSQSESNGVGEPEPR